MRPKRTLLLILLSLLVLTIAVNVGFAQGKAKGEFKTTIKGTINYMKELGGYYVLGEQPGGEFMILNQDPKVLEKLMKSKKIATFEGSLKGAEWLTIEKIDGKPYSGTATSK